MSNDCPVDPTYLTPVFRGTRFESFWHIIKTFTLCQNLDPLAKWDIDNLDESILPHLAQELDVFGDKGWSLADTLAKKRSLLKNALQLHRLAGTPAAIALVFEVLGLGGISFEENPPLVCDGSVICNGAEVCNGKKWDRFIVSFETEPDGSQFELVGRLIDAWKNERSRRILQVNLLVCDGSVLCDGSEIADGLKGN
jgi:hypothetical protein